MKGLDPDLRALQEVRDLVERAANAVEQVRSYDQAATDALCAAMAEAGARAAGELARLAVEETGIGRVHHKILKNLFATEGVWDSIRAEPTVGVIKRDGQGRTLEIATPSGVIAGIVPTTNPTSTALGKSLISVKGRNAIVLSPHPRAKRCIAESAEVLRRAIERAGGPPDLVTCVSNPTIESTGALMKHRKTALILSTGGSGLVRAAYSSGKPAYGVGPGNVPVYIDPSADLAEAARWIVDSQNFDNATLCCSEQALVVHRSIADRFLAALQQRGAHLCNDEERAKLERYANKGGMMNPDIVGIDPVKIAAGAGFQVPHDTALLLAFQEGVGKEHPLSIEILCPLLSVHLVDSWEEGCRVSKEILHFGGLGHTVGLWATDEAVLEAWFLEKPGSRIIPNGPTAQSAVGYAAELVPSLSLGCGPQAGNITSENITARHLINVKRVGWRRPNFEARYVEDIARAAGLGGDESPRGSILRAPGASGSAGSAGVRRAPTSNPAPAPAWSGNPAVVTPAEPRAQAAVRRAPTFTGAAPPPARPVPRPTPATSVARPAPAPRPATGGSVGVGDSLSIAEIQGILEHAGTGCPLGPCKGCPHNDVRTGSCTA